MDQFKPSCSNHHTDKYATRSNNSETVKESNIVHNAEDGSILVTDDEESYTEVPIKDIDLTDKLNDVDSETKSRISIRSPSEETTVDFCDLYNEKTADTESASDTTPTSEQNKQETDEEIIERIDQFMVSKGLLPAGTINCQAIIQLLSNVKIRNIAAKEYLLLHTICEVYKCQRYLPFVSYSLKIDKDKPKEECSLSEKGCKQGDILVDEDQKVPLTAESSSEHKNRKKGAVDETPTQRVHTESTAHNLKINNPQVKKIQECMNPTQGPMCSSNKSLSVDSKATANRDFGKSGDTIPVLPKPVTSTKTIMSKEQTQPVKKQEPHCSSHEPTLVDTKAGANSVPGKSGEGTPALANIEAVVAQIQKKINKTRTRAGPTRRAQTHFTNKSPELIDLTTDSEVQIVGAASGRPISSGSAAETMETLLEQYRRQIIASGITPTPELTNAFKNMMLPGGSSTSTSIYVTPRRNTLMTEAEVGLATVHTLPATIPTHRPNCSCFKLLLSDTKASANNRGKSCESTSVLPKPVTSTKTIVSKEQTRPVEKQITTAVRTSKGPLCSYHKRKLVETIDLTIDGDLPIVEAVSGTSPVAKDTATASKPVETTIVGKYERQIPASGTKPALTNPVKNVTTPAESHAGTSTDMASNSKIVKETSNVAVHTPSVLPGKRKRPVFTFAEPLIVGPPPSSSPDTRRVEENQMSRTPWEELISIPGNPQKKQ